MKANTSIVLLCVSIGIVTLFVSCGSGDDDAMATGPVNVTWWVPNWDEAAARELATAFEAEHEDITIEFVITTWDSMENQIRAGLMSSSPPQLITELESRIRAYARRFYPLRTRDQQLQRSDVRTPVPTRRFRRHI